MSWKYKTTEAIFLQVIAEWGTICYQSLWNVLKIEQRKPMQKENVSTLHIDSWNIKKYAQCMFRENVHAR